VLLLLLELAAGALIFHRWVIRASDTQP
jgi:hypothetical protein